MKPSPSTHTSTNKNANKGEHQRGKLYLVPAPLDFACDIDPLPPVSDVLPQATLQNMARVQHWVCENAKTLRALLKRVDAVQPLAQSIQELHITEIPREWHKKGDHQAMPSMQQAQDLLAPALQGHDVALASEAGMPAVADPGSSLVRAAHVAGIEIVPLVGPCSILLALAASGLNGQQFTFHGYLPQDVQVRAHFLQKIEQDARASGYSQWWIETPYRNQALLQHAVQVLHPSTWLCMASGLTLPQAQVLSQPVQVWRQKNLHAQAPRMPALFGLAVGQEGVPTVRTVPAMRKASGRKPARR